MKAKSKDEWLEYYKCRTGIEDLELLPNELILFHPEHGFVASFEDNDRKLYVHHMCGDGKYWFRILSELMKERGLKTIRACTRRNPKAWIRKYGVRVTGYEMEVGIDELKF